MIAILFCLFQTFTGLSQDAIWNLDLSDKLSEVGWIEQSNDGVILAAGANGMMALNNDDGSVLWENKELITLDRSSFQLIDRMPLFVVEKKGLTGIAGRGFLINSSTGDIYYDTKDLGHKIKSFNILEDQKCILFEFTNKGNRLLMKFNLRTMKEDWTVNIGEAKGLLGKLESTLGLSFITHGPIFTQANTCIVGLDNGDIKAIDFSTGELKWSQENGKKIKALVYSGLNNNLYLGIKGSKKMTLFNPETGQDITPGKLKLRGSLIDIQADGDNLVLVETEGFNLIEPATNELIWKKSFKIIDLDEVIPYGDGYIAIGKNEKGSTVSLVDRSGKKSWDAKVKGYAYYATPTKTGVLYISTERSNILSFTDGKDLWKKDVKFRAVPAVAFDDQEDKVFLFENKKGYKFDLGSGEIDLFAEDIILEDVNKKTPLVAEALAEGYLIQDDQHISMLDRGGSLTYTNYYKPVGGVNFGALARTTSRFLDLPFDLDGALQNLDELKRMSDDVRTVDKDQVKKETSVYGASLEANGQVVAAFEVSIDRFFNSQESRDHKFLTTKLGDNQNFIYMISKISGAVEKKIELKDRTPIYVIDEVDYRAFVLEKNKTITAYALK